MGLRDVPLRFHQEAAFLCWIDSMNCGLPKSEAYEAVWNHALSLHLAHHQRRVAAVSCGCSCSETCPWTSEDMYIDPPSLVKKWLILVQMLSLRKARSYSKKKTLEDINGAVLRFLCSLKRRWALLRGCVRHFFRHQVQVRLKTGKHRAYEIHDMVQANSIWIYHPRPKASPSSLALHEIPYLLESK
jgi:hypothetical protein